MKNIRDFFWKYLGIMIDLETIFAIGIVLLSLIATLIFALLSVVLNRPDFRLLATVVAIPTIVIVLRSSYRALNWSLYDRGERERIEKEVASDRLKRSVRDKRFKE